MDKHQAANRYGRIDKTWVSGTRQTLHELLYNLETYHRS
jgi:hypothetical protein